jgi:hypothetical protein
MRLPQTLTSDRGDGVKDMKEATTADNRGKAHGRIPQLTATLRVVHQDQGVEGHPQRQIAYCHT